MKNHIRCFTLGALFLMLAGGLPFQAAGSQSPQSWLTNQGQTYRTDKNGNYLTGWQEIDGYFYYFNKDGIMQTGWTEVEGVWYYLKENGIMHTGWLRDDDAWFYLNGSGIMEVGWVYSEGNWYYLKETGRMTIMNQQEGNSVYRFSATGELSTVAIDSEIEYGSFEAFFLDSEEQTFMDYLNDARGDHDKKSLILDYTLNQVASDRLDGALKYGYYTKNRTVVGQGSLKDHLKEINYYPNRGVLELYLRGADMETAFSTFVRSAEYTKLLNYNRAGISVQEKNDRYYIIVVLMK